MRLLISARGGQARIVDDEGGAEARGGDIAVLVRTVTSGARAVREALAALGVACVQRGGANVFACARRPKSSSAYCRRDRRARREPLIGAALATDDDRAFGRELHARKGDETVEKKWWKVSRGPPRMAGARLHSDAAQSVPSSRSPLPAARLIRTGSAGSLICCT